jgi:hypothetical protein
MTSTESEYIVESEVIIRAVDRPFPDRQRLGVFSSASAAYQFIQKYITDTKELHTYFSRSYICEEDEYEERIRSKNLVAMNIVLGQFEDLIYVRNSK